MTQPGGFARSGDSPQPDPAADDQAGEPSPVAGPEGSDSPTPPTRRRSKAVVIAIAAVLGLALFGAGVGTPIALSGSRTGSGAATSNPGAGGALRLPGKLLGLDRNTYQRVSSSGFSNALVAHYVSAVYGAGLPHTPTVAVVGGRLTRAGQSEAHIAPAVMALNAVQFRGSTNAQKFPAGHVGAGIACAYFSEPTFGMAIACFSVDQTTIFHAIYLGGAASSLPDAAAKTLQIRQELER